MDDKVTIEADSSIASLIMTYACYHARCVTQGVSAEHQKIKPEHVKEAADLVFLALELIRERKAE